MTKIHTTNPLTLGVDTHLDKHVAVLLNAMGKHIDTAEFPVCEKGYQELLAWCRSFGQLTEAGIEGTGSYGAGLCRFLEKSNVCVYEVNRPNRAKRRLVGKSDTIDAENAARSVLAKESTAIPKSHDGKVEALRYFMVVRRSTVKSRTQTVNQIRALLVTAPDCIKRACYVPSTFQCIQACLSL